MDPEIDFGALFAQFDTALMGRHTYEMMVRSGQGANPGMKTHVFSRTLRPSDHPAVTVIPEAIPEAMRELKEQPGKDLWLFGGGSLFRSLAEAKLVDTVEVAVVPILLGGGIPVLPPPASRIALRLESHRVYGSGIVSLNYAVA
jgi:dihydrofolate reductase